VGQAAVPRTEGEPGPASTDSPKGDKRVSEHTSGLARWLPPAICLALYFVLALARFGLFSPLGAGHITGVRTIDQEQQIWFLAWAHYAVIHGQNPLFTQLQNYPVGINLGVNTSMLALGTVFSPVTSLFGPIVTWNILMRLGLFISASSMCFVLRRWVSWWPAAFVGGLLYGFSAFATFNSIGYLFLVFTPLPPLIFLTLHEIMVRQRWRPARAGLAFGVLCAVQYFISSELLASTLLIGALGCLIAAVASRSQKREHLVYTRNALMVGVLSMGALLIYPIAFTLFGPGHINGVPTLGNAPGDLLGHFVPSNVNWLSPHFAASVWTNFGLFFASAPTYQGLPFLIAVVWIVVALRRNRTVLLAGALAAIAFVLSLGSHLVLDGHDTGLPLPFILLAHLPITNGLVAPRFSLFVDLFAALIIAIGIDHLYRRLADHKLPGSSSLRSSRLLAAGAAIGVAAVIAVPLLPRSTQGLSSARSAKIFASHSSRLIAPGDVALVYPYPTAPIGAVLFGTLNVQRVGDGLLDQAVSGLDFKLIGGYGWTPGHSGGLANASPLEPNSIETLFSTAFYGKRSPEQQALLSKSDLANDLRTFLVRYDVGTVMVLPLGEQPKIVTDLVSSAIGPPRYVGTVATWGDVQGRLRSESP